MKTFVQLMIKCFLFFFLGYELIVNLNSNTWLLMKDSFYSTLIQTDDIVSKYDGLRIAERER